MTRLDNNNRLYRAEAENNSDGEGERMAESRRQLIERVTGLIGG
jgi:hypothetical protein